MQHIQSVSKEIGQTFKSSTNAIINIFFVQKTRLKSIFSVKNIGIDFKLSWIFIKKFNNDEDIFRKISTDSHCFMQNMLS